MKIQYYLWTFIKIFTHKSYLKNIYFDDYNILTIFLLIGEREFEIEFLDLKIKIGLKMEINGIKKNNYVIHYKYITKLQCNRVKLNTYFVDFIAFNYLVIFIHCMTSML